MRLYEIVYIFDASLDEDAINRRLEKYHGLATAGGGEVNAVDHWGIRQLAYPIRRKRSGYYVVAQFNADPSSLVEMERVLKLDEELMRFLIVLNEGEPTSGMSIVAQKPPVERGEDEEEDDEEEEEEDDDEETPPEFSGGRGRRRRHEGPAIELLNYKDVSTLSRFLTEQGKILPKRTTKVTARFQRQLGSAVKRARYLALVPYVRQHEG
jgi:small subunit ribosomal protein S6